MGLYDALTKAHERSAVKKYDSHNNVTETILDSSADGITPESTVEWKVASVPSTIKTPATATLQEAEQEELEAINHQNAVEYGIRVLKARSKKVKQTAKLVAHHRQHLGSVAKSTLSMAASNVGLAKQLQNMRAGYARLGHGLDEKVQTVDHQIAKIRAKYNQGQQ